MRNWVADKFGRNRVRTTPTGHNPAPARVAPAMLSPLTNSTARVDWRTTSYYVTHGYYYTTTQWIAWSGTTWGAPTYPDTLRLPEGV